MTKKKPRPASWLTALTGTGAGATAVLALLVLVTVFVAVVTPRASVAFRTKALQQLFARTPPTGRAVVASSDYPALANALGVQPGVGGLSQQQVNAVGAEIAHNLRSRNVPLRPSATRWWGIASGYSDVPDAPRRAYFGSAPPQLEVLYRPLLERYSALVRGAMPQTARTTSAPPRFQVVVTQATAARFALHPGSALSFPGHATFIVSGIIRPLRPHSTFWTADPNAAAATFNKTRMAGFWLGAVFIGRGELDSAELALDTSQMSLQWQYPLRLAAVSATQAAGLSTTLNGAVIGAGLLTRSVKFVTSVTLNCGLTGDLSEFVRAQGRIGSLLALLDVSLTILGAVVLVLGARLLAERRADECALMRSRGAAQRQLAALALRAGLVAVLPAGTAGAAIAVLLTPGGDEPIGVWFGALTALAALIGVPALTLRRVPAMTAGTQRADVPPGRQAQVRRLVADLTLVLAAAGGIGVLRQQGMPSPGQTDWFTSAAPVLVALLVAVIVVRAFPIAVRWLVRLTGRHHAVTTFVGLARAARTSLTAVLPAFALVLVLGVVAFGATLRAAVVRGDTAASWRATGADVVIDASGSTDPLDSAAQRALARLPGVDRAAAVGTLVAVAADGSAVSVVVVDPARYAALIAATPLPAFPASALALPSHAGRPARIPVLASPAARRLIGRRGRIAIGYHNLPVRIAGRIKTVPGAGGDSSGTFIVAPELAMARTVGTAAARPTRMLLVGPGIDTARLRVLVRQRLRAATMTLRAKRIAALADAALPHGTYVAYAQGAAAAAGFGIVIVLLTLALGARSRELTLARLFTMGLSSAQARRLAITEALPLLAGAAAGGTLCAWLLVPLIGPAIDLSPLTGTSAPVTVRADYAVLAIMAAGLLVLAMATLFAQSAATRLRGLARALRVGE